MKKLYLFAMLSCFLLYWMSTILFTMPENYFEIEFGEQRAFFDRLFYQRWSFFAPPPQFNDRLYYVIRDKKSRQQHTFEVIRQITTQKQLKAPFNQEENLLDYAVNNSVLGLKDIQRENVRLVKYIFPDSSDSFISRKTLTLTWQNNNTSEAIRTLKRYGVMVALKNNLNPADQEFKMVLSQKNLPKFKDRNNKNAKTEEVLVFESPFYSASLNN
ncbi:MAG TPA: hypothetical protein VM802_18275 [Chitinophaga sp.]|uniref:hypothetical protein n=1 Tax=Chitinophaga sp. TaxID=1869181 RepID=UPI002C99B10D|nr:hypothetical protein [Chitinophaga sp.]HVI46832.1 hypothetical protein [Chitinophaga sp.]